jgi:competence protein ComEC
MLRVCLAFLCGAYVLGFCSALPDRTMACVAATAAACCLLHRHARLAGVFIAGFVFAWSDSARLIDDRVLPAQVGQTVAVRVQIADFVQVNKGSARFVANVLENNALPSRLRLSWQDAEAIPQIGETWDLRLRLRPPRGYSNPSGFDYEAWLFRNGIGATGYVVSGSLNHTMRGVAGSNLLQLRARIARRIERLLPADDASAVLAAITVGARHKVSRDAWLRYARTGTSHLMAISGLHIGLAGGAALLIVWCLSALFLRRANIHDLAVFFALPVICLYASIAGMAVPAQRAGLMAIVAAVAVLGRRPLTAWRQLSLVCLVSVFAGPGLIRAPGFQLSFAAVAILLWIAMQFRAPATDRRAHPVQASTHRICELWRLQLALLFGLFALSAILFSRAVWLAPIVNIIVVPIFGLTTVPLSLAGLLLDGPLRPVGDTLLLWSYESVRAVLFVIGKAANLPLADIRLRSINGPIAVIAAITAVRVVLPPGWPGRRLAWLALLAVVLYRPPPPPANCVDLHVLDVGQGLTAVLRTTEHTIVFDTGPSFRNGSDTALLVTIPFLDGIGAERVDLLVVSHADLDHAGGVASLLGARTVLRSVAGEPDATPLVDPRPCHSGQHWVFDALELSVLHPSAGSAWTGNNASCVLLAKIGEHRILLTGDIESAVENLLAGQLPKVDTVLVPHHGSNTSSSTKFVDALRPNLAIVSAGYANRWGFPKPEVVDRWQHVGSVVANTAADGALAQRYCRGAPAALLRRHRRDTKRLWHMPAEP